MSNKSIFKLNHFFKKTMKFVSKNKHWFILLGLIIILKIFTPSTFLILTYACLFFLFFYPIIVRLQSLLRSNTLTVTVFIIVLTFLIVIILGFLIPTLVNQIVEFSKNYTQIQKSLGSQIDVWQNSLEAFQLEFLKITNISTNGVFTKYIHQWGQAILTFFDGMVQAISGVFTKLLQIFIAFIFSLYLLFERKTIFKFFNVSFEKKASVKEIKLLALVYEQVMAYFSGLLLLSFIDFFIAWIFLGFIGLNFALLFAIFTGLMQFIPIFGPLVAATLIIILAWTQSAEMVFPLVVFFLLLQILESYILAPILLGNKSQLSPTSILLTMLIGAELYGILGMIIAIPLASLGRLSWKVYSDQI